MKINSKHRPNGWRAHGRAARRLQDGGRKGDALHGGRATARGAAAAAGPP